ncbi:MAG: EscU/YscU/HrcU family type III secretion system export apparatus switch protein [Nitrospinae bacterium]|nr:EscU/YscU/HrcU family type III secretion system export apparatus switch protein [Nitrospinota bacterium]
MGDEKRTKAVALKYDRNKDGVPKVAAKGKGELAERIIAIAKGRGIPIREDADLVEVLSGLDLDNEIPPALYKAVAEILAFVYRVNSRKSSPVAGPPFSSEAADR